MFARQDQIIVKCLLTENNQQYSWKKPSQFGGFFVKAEEKYLFNPQRIY